MRFWVAPAGAPAEGFSPPPGGLRRTSVDLVRKKTLLRSFASLVIPCLSSLRDLSPVAPGQPFPLHALSTFLLAPSVNPSHFQLQGWDGGEGGWQWVSDFRTLLLPLL